MASEIHPASRTATNFTLQNDKRDIKDLWNDALRDYKDTVGRDLQMSFKNVDDMLQYGLGQKDTFSKWRHDGKKLDKIRQTFMQNIGYIEIGTQKLLAAATPAFPPAAAISTALTFVLNACKGQSDDYDVVACFFEDMNSFLQKVTILEGRLPEYRAYQTCLMDVFTSFLAMCAFATKFISKGRFKTWIINSFKGQDADLSSARKRMDKNIQTLESATEIAILANTEGLKGGQQGLQLMQEELRENQVKQLELAQEQTRLLETIQQGQLAVKEGVDGLKTDVQAILALMKQDSNNSTAPTNEQPGSNLNKVSTTIRANTENDARMSRIDKTRVTGTGEWLFQTQAWKSWCTPSGTNLLLVEGPPGIGKSYLAAAAHRHLRQVIEADPERLFVATYFFCDDEVDNLQSFDSFISSVVLQISDQNPVLRDRFGQQLTVAREADQWGSPMSEDRYWKELIAPCFGKNSKYRLHIVVDSADELEAHAIQDLFVEMVNEISELALNVKILATVRSMPSAGSRRPLPPRFQGLSRLLTFTVSKDNILPDIKLLIADRMQGNDKTQDNLAHLQAKTQQRIAENIEEKADTLLYVGFAFRYLSGIGREGAIIRELDVGLAKETSALFEGILKRCKRHLPHDLLASVQLLLIWLTYSFDLLDLDQANQLVQFSSQDEHLMVEDEIEYALGRILQIGPATRTSDGSSDLNLERTLRDATFVDSVQDDGDLLVSLRDQSMKELFRNIEIRHWGDRNNTTKSQEAHRSEDAISVGHRAMFLLCCDILERQPGSDPRANTLSGEWKLRFYALKYCLRHWQNIDCERHGVSENMEVCTAFFRLLSNRHGLADAYELAGGQLNDVVKKASTMSPETGLETFLLTWQRWAEFVQKVTTSPVPGEYEPASQNDKDAEFYWKGSHDHAFVPLFEAHMENWLNGTTDLHRIFLSYSAAVRLYTHIPDSDRPRASAADEYRKTWGFTDEHRSGGTLTDAEKKVYTLRASWGKPLTSTAHFATAVALQIYAADEAAYRELQLSTEKCYEMGQKAWIYIQLSHMCQRLGRGYGLFDDDVNVATKEKQDFRRKNFKQALEYLDIALKYIPDTTSPTRLTALITRIGLLKDYKRLLNDKSVDGEIAEIFRDLKASSTLWIIDSANLLSMEIEFLSENYDQLITLFTGLSPIQRLSAVMDLHQHNSIFLPAAVLTRRTAEIQSAYYEILDTLNLGGYGVVWYTKLAQYLYRAAKDLHLASDVLRQASSHVFEGSIVKIRGETLQAADLSEEWLNLASDVVYQQLRSSNAPDVKLEHLQEAEALPLQPIVQSVQTKSIRILPYLIVLARMQKRMGSFHRYQETIQKAFDICWDNLHDNFLENDSKTLRCLSKILAMRPNFDREAGIISSSQLYTLTNTLASETSSQCEEAGESEVVNDREASGMEESTDNMTFDYIPYWMMYQDPPIECSNADIGHKCPSSVRWLSWERPMYICLCCTNSFLCQDCYDERIKRNTSRDEDIKVDFCCDGGDYLKAPTAGWKGIRDGVIYIENEEPIEVIVFLDQLKQKWKQAWNEFWKG